MIQRNDECWCGSGKKWKKCHYPQEASNETSQDSDIARRYKKHFDIILKTDEQIEGIREACRLAAYILDETCKRALPGVTTNSLNDFAHALHKEKGAIPAPLNYGQPPYPKSICTSLNEVVCHGIPNDTPLVEGDICNIDVTCIYKGYYGDCSRMVVVGGKTTEERQRVVDVSYECLMRSIDILKPGVSLYAIGDVITDYAEEYGCSVVYQFVGHGIGINFHEAPQVYHNRNDMDIPLAPGMIFTIEPMINAGRAKAVIDASDKWTAYTVDGKASGQWEHTILITPEGHEIMTVV
jgi:methionyl aminopeptidase